MLSPQTRSHWLHEKTEARANGGMVTSRHPQSAEAGVEILRAGGNAVDAAVAASFAESVVQPAASTIGGGGLFSVRFPDGRAEGINYLWQAPSRATADMFPLDGKAERGLFGWMGVKDSLNEIGALAAAIPGSVAGLVKANKTHGRLPLATVMQPAIRLADNGFEMDWYGSLMAGIHLDILKRFPTTARMLLRDGVYPYRPNMIGAADVHRQPELAQTLSAIAAEGASAFYTGPIAASIVEAINANGGRFSLEDLANYEAIAETQAEVSYRGYKVQGVPTGFSIYAMVLTVLSHFPMGSFAPDSVERLHLFIETFRHCRRDRNLGSRDARIVDARLTEMLTPAYAAKLAAQISPTRRADIAPPWPDATAAATEEKTRTVHLAAIDGDGCVASLTETVIGNYGCFVTSDTGVLLNNGMISFAPVAGQPDSIAPSKRLSSFISPLQISNPNDSAVVTIGCSGGQKIPTAVLQIATLMLDHGLSPQAAVSFPRVDFEGDLVVLDARFGHATADALRDLGHTVVLRAEELSTFEFGNASVIARDADGVIRAGVNPFQATAAVGFDRA